MFGDHVLGLPVSIVVGSDPDETGGEAHQRVGGSEGEGETDELFVLLGPARARWLLFVGWRRVLAARVIS
jgi:hypothetical protein